jgi:Ca2+-binding EF-hand superfamily protein
MNRYGNTKGRWWTLGLLAGLAVAPVLANGASVQALFAQADANGDGGLDAAEYRRYMELGFAQDDATGDGSLDRQEMAQAMAKASQVKLSADAPQIQRAVGMTFPMLDSDGDGLISRQESLRYVQEGFKAIDVDGDGRVSLQELLSTRSGRGRGR